MMHDDPTGPARERAELDAGLYAGRWWAVLSYGITAGALTLTYMIQLVTGLHLFGHWWPVSGLLAMAIAATAAQLVHQRRLRDWQTRGGTRT
jgi:hypothetical protein